MLSTSKSSRTSLSYPRQQTLKMLTSTNKTHEILSALGVAARISCLPSTHSRFTVRTKEIQNGGWGGHVYTCQAQIVTIRPPCSVSVLFLTKHFYTKGRKNMKNQNCCVKCVAENCSHNQRRVVDYKYSV